MIRDNNLPLIRKDFSRAVDRRQESRGEASCDLIFRDFEIDFRDAPLETAATAADMSVTKS